MQMLERGWIGRDEGRRSHLGKAATPHELNELAGELVQQVELLNIARLKGFIKDAVKKADGKSPPLTDVSSEDVSSLVSDGE
jgi:hypothetical protein